MDNNDVLRKIRYILDLSETQMVKIFANVEAVVTPETITAWLKREEDPDFIACGSSDLAGFLNGLIIEKRGRREGPVPPTETVLTNNMIFRKLRIAFNLQSEDILSLLDEAGVSLSKHELSAFFRKVGHKHYRACQDQVLRNFLKALSLKYRQGEA